MTNEVDKNASFAHVVNLVPVIVVPNADGRAVEEQILDAEHRARVHDRVEERRERTHVAHVGRGAQLEQALERLVVAHHGRLVHGRERVARAKVEMRAAVVQRHEHGTRLGQTRADRERRLAEVRVEVGIEALLEQAARLVHLVLAHQVEEALEVRLDVERSQLLLIDLDEFVHSLFVFELQRRTKFQKKSVLIQKSNSTFIWLGNFPWRTKL